MLKRYGAVAHAQRLAAGREKYSASSSEQKSSHLSGCTESSAAAESGDHANVCHIEKHVPFPFVFGNARQDES